MSKYGRPLFIETPYISANLASPRPLPRDFSDTLRHLEISLIKFILHSSLIILLSESFILDLMMVMTLHIHDVVCMDNDCIRKDTVKPV